MAEVADTGQSLGAVIRRVADEVPEAVAGHAITMRLREACRSPEPNVVASIGQMLVSVGFLAQAESVFRALADLCPAMPAGLSGLAQVATQRKAWSVALQRWDEVIAGFPRHDGTYWVAMRARVLFELGRHEEAAAILHAVSHESSHQPHGLIGLAHLAMRRNLWMEALGLWEEVLARFPQHDSVPYSMTARGSTLIELGRYTEAEAVLRPLIRGHPWAVGARAALMRVLAETHTVDEAIRESEGGDFAGASIPLLWHTKIGILLEWRRLDEARVQFTRCLQYAVDLESMTRLFEAVPLLFDGWPRTRAWIQLLRQLDEAQRCTDPQLLYLYRFLRARIKLALRDHQGYLDEFRLVGELNHFGELGAMARVVARALTDPQYPDSSKPKVFGIGLSRTATTSLAAALHTLGLSTLHWTNPLTCELVSNDDAQLFDALTDKPVCLEFEKYFYQFPASKFVYTVRPMDSWINSVNGHWKKVLNISEFAEFKRQADSPDSFRFGREYCRIHQLLFLNHGSLSQAYEAYDQRVRRFFSDKPKDRLLVLNIFAGQGWPELCLFLGKQVPSMQFPFDNALSGARAG